MSEEDEAGTGERLAVEIREELSQMGFRALTSNIIRGVGLWWSWFQNGNSELKISLGLYSLKDSSSHVWAIWFSSKPSGFFAFFRKAAGVGLEFQEEFASRLEKNLICTDLVWMTEDEFQHLI
jgi:hypothetical protein